MGLDKMFSNSADFSDLLETNEPLKVSKVVHKAFIEVNEEGAEAAAATGRLIFPCIIAFLHCFVFHVSFVSLLFACSMFYFLTFCLLHNKTHNNSLSIFVSCKNDEKKSSHVP